MFTNVPIEETLDIVTNSIYENNGSFRNIQKEDFRKLLKVCVDDNHFQFNNKHYVQHEGFAMGSPLSAPMANIFLCYHERRWLDECPLDFKPLLYKRYVDDTFLIFKKKEHVNRFLVYLNNKHRNINFTLEEERNNNLSFLDVNITKHFNAGNFSLDFSNLERKLLLVWE